jgi:hypothetical protein
MNKEIRAMDWITVAFVAGFSLLGLGILHIFRTADRRN